ncbi:MAG: hypothetical protein IJN31_02755 [Peptococcaceae bacterium]|nr:hypothetical protein [Peptococcaceae bacterium]
MKIISIMLAFILLLGLAGCKEKESSEFDLKKIAAMSEAVVESHLVGTSRDAILNAWGEPDEILFGIQADVYQIPDSSKQLILYYDDNGKLMDIKILENVAEK